MQIAKNIYLCSFVKKIQAREAVKATSRGSLMIRGYCQRNKIVTLSVAKIK